MYNGREIMAQIAEKNGWTIKSNGAVGGNEGVRYQRKGTDERVIIYWTPENAAAYVGYAPNWDTFVAQIKGMTALIQARKIMEMGK